MPETPPRPSARKRQTDAYGDLGPWRYDMYMDVQLIPGLGCMPSPATEPTNHRSGSCSRYLFTTVTLERIR